MIERTSLPRASAAEAAAAREPQKRIHSLFLNPSRVAMAFQPILDLREETLVGAEALGRLADGVLPVPKWIEGAQTAGVGIEVEVMLMKAAFAQLDALSADLFMAVNISPEALCSPAFFTCIAEHDIGRVVFELTEHTPFPEARLLAKQMAFIRERGGRIALDDVGSGFTSIRHVLALAPEFIKLDRTLVELAEHEARHRAMVRALCRFGEETGSAVIAEGVETSQQLDMLRHLGVGYGQGFLWARPGPIRGEEPQPGSQARAIPELVAIPGSASRRMHPSSRKR